MIYNNREPQKTLLMKEQEGTVRHSTSYFTKWWMCAMMREFYFTSAQRLIYMKPRAMGGRPKHLSNKNPIDPDIGQN